MSAMTPRRLDWALRTRGPALDAWPEAERNEALELLRQDPAARQAFADALAAEEEDPASEAEAQAVCRMHSAVRRALAPPPPVVRGIGFGAMAACLAAGLYLGVSTVESETASALGPATDASLSATVLAALDP